MKISLKYAALRGFFAALALFVQSNLLAKSSQVQAQTVAGDGLIPAIYLDFEDASDLEDLGYKYGEAGVLIGGGTALEGIALHESYDQYTPKSGKMVLVDGFGSNASIHIFIDPSIVIRQVEFYASFKYQMNVYAYAHDSTLLYDLADPYPNWNTSEENRFFSIKTEKPVTELIIFSSNVPSNVSVENGNTFAIDDLSFSDPGCLLNVPLYKQDDPSWKNDEYGAVGWKSGSYRENLLNWGCLTSSYAMVLSYHGSTYNGTAVNPRQLNNWLRENGGYSGGNVIHAEVARYAREVMFLPLWFNDKLSGKNDKLIESYLCHGFPVVLSVPTSRASHYAVAKAIYDGDFSVNDPIFEKKSINQDYGGQYFSANFMSTSKSHNVLEIVTNDQFELILVNDQGLRTGFDNKSKRELNEIPGAQFFREYFEPPSQLNQDSPSASDTKGFPDQKNGLSANRIMSSEFDPGSYTLYIEAVFDAEMDKASDFLITLYGATEKTFERKDILPSQIKKGDVIIIKFNFVGEDHNQQGEVFMNYQETIFKEEGMPIQTIFLPMIFE